MVTAGAPVLWIIRRRRASCMVEPGGGPTLLDGCVWSSAGLWVLMKTVIKMMLWFHWQWVNWSWMFGLCRPHTNHFLIQQKIYSFKNWTPLEQFMTVRKTLIHRPADYSQMTLASSLLSLALSLLSKLLRAPIKRLVLQNNKTRPCITVVHFRTKSLQFEKVNIVLKSQQSDGELVC